MEFGLILCRHCLQLNTMGNLLLRRRMMMSQGKAALDYGVYIQDTNGKLWKAGAWDGSATPNGVAVYDESCSFIIALDGDAQLPINSATGLSSLTEFKTEETAKADFDGAGNTDTLLSDYGSVTTESAGYCAAYTFPRGEVGYLGSAGEWNTALKYKDEIDAIMALLGGDALKTSYWTSTYYGRDSTRYLFWYFIWEDGSSAQAGDMNYEYVTSAIDYTRPFGVLDIQGVVGGSGTAKTLNAIKINGSYNSDTQIVAYWVESQYPVASDITVTAKRSSKVYTVTISKGKTKSGTASLFNASITSVTPAEDDKYIYTF